MHSASKFEHTCNYCILSSKRPSPCKHPPPFDDPMVDVYMRYAYKWLVCVSAHPRVLARQFQASMGAYSREYMYVRELEHEEGYSPTLQRLPLTIPELVHISPTMGNDGLLYTGQCSRPLDCLFYQRTR